MSVLEPAPGVMPSIHSPAYQDWVLGEVMDRINAFVYVTDIDTDEILFMNKNMKEAFGLPHPEGEPCWRVLQRDAVTRCPSCPVQVLVSGMGKDFYIWEEHNTVTGRFYENYDSLMRWTDGRLVHFQQSIDVTESRRLFKFANLDELTGILNRRAGKDALEKRLEQARSAGQTVTLCMFDVDGLKAINDKHGHLAGDEVLRRVVDVVKTRFRQDDLFFRLSSDEFVLTLGDGGFLRAQEAMASAQNELSCLNTPISFSFGVLEFSPATRALTTEEALSAVDERLYEQKRTRHINQVVRRLDSPVHSQPFSYPQELLYDALIHSTEDYLYISNLKTGVFCFPPAMVEEFGLPCQIIENATAIWGAKIHPDDKMAFLESNQEIMDGRSTSHCVEYRAVNRRGEWVWLRCRGHAVHDAAGEPALFAGFITNLGKRSRIDHLTGLLDKLELEEDAGHLLQGGGTIALLVFGIDGLKKVNSLYDHAFGDEVIRITSQKLRSFLPANAQVYRMDGDEFGVILRGGDRATVESFYRELQVLFDRQQTCGGKPFHCTLSCGCAFSPDDGGDYGALLKHAHFALGYAKTRGKNQLCFFSREVLRVQERALELTELLRESVEHGFQGFELYFQPIFSCENEQLVGAEALCRWKCEKYGPVTPLEFIPLLEESGLIHPAGRWIFRQAVKTCACWQQERPDFMMSVNFSYLQLEDPSFLSFVAEVLSQYRVSPSRLITELTESHLASNIQEVSESLVKLRQMDALISMDDFGTGYSSLALLNQHPIDIVKIDRSFVQGIRTSAFNSAFIRFVADLCHSVGIRVCLEGVETRDEVEFVRPFGLNFLQGFYFGRPVPGPEFENRFLSE